MLYLSGITSTFLTIATIVIVGVQITFHAQCVRVFMIQISPAYLQ
jgi:hypothetical protein